MDQALPFQIIGLISLVAVMVYLRTILGTIPALVACLIRSKENINIEESAKHVRERDVTFWLLLFPALLAIAWYNLWCIEFFDSWNPGFRLLASAGIMAALIGVKLLLARIFEPRAVNRKVYNAVKFSARNYFIIGTLLSLATIGTMSFLGADNESIRHVTLCIAGVVYTLFAIRKLEIFLSFRDIFTSILYLCALELLPTGGLVAAAIYF